MAGAIEEQNWKQQVANVFNKYGGASERHVYPILIGEDLG